MDKLIYYNKQEIEKYIESDLSEMFSIRDLKIKCDIKEGFEYIKSIQSFNCIVIFYRNNKWVEKLTFMFILNINPDNVSASIELSWQTVKSKLAETFLESLLDTSIELVSVKNEIAELKKKFNS